MSTFFRKSVLGLLSWLAKCRMKRLRPFVIGVSGSIGKTSTKDAIYHLLKSRYTVVRNEKSFNSEFGLPLAILEQPSGFSSAWSWILIIVKAFWKAFIGGKNLQIMVLEMGADKPGDMAAHLKFVQPQVGIVTNIKPVHLGEGQFKDLDDIFLEKSRLVMALPEKGTAILNADDGYLVSLREKLQCKTIFYGVSETADLRVLELESSLTGIHCTVSYKDEVVSGDFPLPGAFQVYVLLAALAAAITQGFSLAEAFESLKNFKLPPGRMNLLSGINGTTLIDSSYNASPETVKEALDLLQKANKGRRIAILGSMNELGPGSERFHRDIGRYAVGRADILVTVGELARDIADEAGKEGFPAQDLYACADVFEAENRVKTFLREGDTVLIKGSQNQVRLERLAKALMADPTHAEELLVRQEKHWRNIQ